MQTILGSNGQIGTELAKELYKNYTHDIRLVSRHPNKIHPSDELIQADLFKYEEAYHAISGSDIVYFTVGLPYELWEKQFLTILNNVIQACIETDTKLVYFDNTYMYAKNNQIQVDDSSFEPVGTKSAIRAEMTNLLLESMHSGKVDAVIARAPEFYGPNQTQSITNTMIFNRVKAKQRAIVPLSDSALRTLIWTPDASRALALIGNTADTYGQTWHLPTASSLSYKDIISKTETITGQKIKYTVIPMWLFKLVSHFNSNAKKLLELLPRYKYDNVFSSDKFKHRFPTFKITSFNEGIQQIFQK